MTNVASLSLILIVYSASFVFFFFNDTATTEIYPFSLHDALPISSSARSRPTPSRFARRIRAASCCGWAADRATRSEEHTSELQSQSNLVCRLLLEKKKKSQISGNVLQRRSHIPTHACMALT